ncbi:MAG TPA: hypothetical protein VMU34_22970 [Mycobacterium sp.]|nr:hypothetical protein [Mycobacterium sp.]
MSDAAGREGSEAAATPEGLPVFGDFIPVQPANPATTIAALTIGTTKPRFIDWRVRG